MGKTTTWSGNRDHPANLDLSFGHFPVGVYLNGCLKPLTRLMASTGTRAIYSELWKQQINGLFAVELWKQ